MLVGALAGRAAEELVFDTVTTGAANDIEQATRVARAMITQYGMSDKFGLMGLATQEDQYLTGRTVMNCGDATAAEVDAEVMKMLKEAYEEAKSLLSENRDVMDKIAEFLIENDGGTGNSGTLENPAAGEVSAVSEEKKDAGDGFGDMFGNPDFGEVKR